jgi:DNA-binding MarR family transcriptional regulator
MSPALKRERLHAELNRAVRLFIAGSSLYSQRVAETLGLHPTDLQFLNVLELLGPLTPKALGAYSGLSSGGVTVALDRLEKAGYIRRTANPDDRRSVLVNLAPERQGEVKAHYDAIDQRFGALLAACPIEELETVLAFLGRMNDVRPSEN